MGMKKTDLFKGFIPTKNKKSLVKFKDASNLKTYDEVIGLDEFAGVLDENTVLVDVDDEKQSEILMDIVEELQLDCLVNKTTRGMHFFFLNNGKVKSCHTGVNLACGLKADIKVGCKNSIAILKYAEKERETEWDINPDGQYQEIPFFLLPTKSDIDMFGLKKGDGRNQSLFNYILTLTNKGFSKTEVRETLNIINNHIFTDKLSDSEIDTITRDDAFPKETFFDKQGFHHDLFGNYLIKEKNIAMIDGTLHIFKDGVYVQGNSAIETAMVEKLPILKSNQRSEVLKYIELVAPKLIASDAKYVAFSNGVYDLENDCLLDFSSDFVLTNKIPFSYKLDAYDKTTDDTLNKMACGDKQIRALIEECIGYCFYRRNDVLQKSFLFVGDKSNGKSTFLETLRHLLGNDNVSSLDLSELDERFSIAELAGKLVNIGDDISDEFLQGRSVSIFKKIVTGNSVKAEFKGRDVFFFSPYAKLLFSANTIPRTKDKTGALLRRLIIIPFNATFSKNDPDYDPFIGNKLKSDDAMEYLINIGVEGLRRIIINKAFTNSSKVDEAIKQYDLDNNPVLAFIAEGGNIRNEAISDVYRRYALYCTENGYQAMTKASFSKEIMKRLNLESKVIKINGHTVRIYV